MILKPTSSTGETSDAAIDPKATAVARCHEIHLSLQGKDVPEFDALAEVGMAVHMALHIRGLPLLNYEKVRLVAAHFWNMPSPAVKQIVLLLEEVGFLRIASEGQTIKSILPTVPYYADLYTGLGDAFSDRQKNEAEELALELTNRLAKSPEKVDRLRHDLGAEERLFKRGLSLGQQGKYLNIQRCRGKDIALYPLYFSENATIFADHVAAKGSQLLKNLNHNLQQYQGWPLELIKREHRIGEASVSPVGVDLLQRLAHAGAVKPPSIETTHSGKTHFMFTPGPEGANVSPLRREIYERAMAIVAAVRQGQLLPNRFAIRNPGAVIYTLKNELQLGRATTEAQEQYRTLTHLRIATLEDLGNGFHQLKIIDEEENREALDIAYKLITGGEIEKIEIDKEARTALEERQHYVESLVASKELQKRFPVPLDPDETSIEDILLGLTSDD